MFTKEDYVSLETAKMLKEKGFDLYCLAFYKDGKFRLVRSEWEGENIDTLALQSRGLRLDRDNQGDALAPTLYEAQKWIWERYKMFVSAAPNSPFTAPLEFFFWIDFPTETLDAFDSLITEEHFSTFQQALDAGIRKVGELIKEE